jgi:hypothetical protein
MSESDEDAREGGPCWTRVPKTTSRSGGGWRSLPFQQPPGEVSARRRDVGFRLYLVAALTRSS